MLAVLFAFSTLSAAIPQPTRLTVTIQGSIEATLQRALPAKEASELAAQVARLMRWRGDFIRHAQKDDVMTLLYEPGETQSELVAVAYRGHELSLSAYRYTGADGVPRFYDETGTLIEPGIKNSPVARYTQITERVDPGRGNRRHAGMDFKAPTGTPVRLPFAGVVTRVNWRRANGRCVEVEVAGNRLVRFLHLDSIAKNVKAGVKLAASAPIGTVGNTGHSNAPHLHYEIRNVEDQPMEPDKIHGTYVVKLGTDDATRFAAMRGSLDRRLAGSPSAVASAAAAATSAQ
jgi:murein DD-endopeptidase MepM/ murein hydrolase activator NlpD